MCKPLSKEVGSRPRVIFCASADHVVSDSVYSFVIGTPLNIPLLQPILYTCPHMYLRKIVTLIRSVLVLQGGQEMNSEKAGVGSSDQWVKQRRGIPCLVV